MSTQQKYNYLGTLLFTKIAINLLWKILLAGIYFTALWLTLFLLLSFPLVPPTKPGDLKVIGVNRDTMTLTWSASTCDTDYDARLLGYVVEMKTSQNDTWEVIGHNDRYNTTFKVTNLTEGLTYWYRVRGQNLAGYSEPGELDQGVVAKPPYGKDNKHFGGTA